MTQDIAVNKSKFDRLLRKMLETPPLPKSEVRTPRSTKKRKKSVA